MIWIELVTRLQQSNSDIFLDGFVALIAVIGTIASPLLVAQYMNRVRIKEKIDEDKRRNIDNQVVEQTRKDERLADFERTEAVRKMAADAASLLETHNKELAESSKRTEIKLDTIHKLMNSNLTTALQAEMDSLREFIEWKEHAGEPVGAASRRLLISLEHNLHERKQAQILANENIKDEEDSMRDAGQNPETPSE